MMNYRQRFFLGIILMCQTYNTFCMGNLVARVKRNKSNLFVNINPESAATVRYKLNEARNREAAPVQIPAMQEAHHRVDAIEANVVRAIIALPTMVLVGCFLYSVMQTTYVGEEKVKLMALSGGGAVFGFFYLNKMP